MIVLLILASRVRCCWNKTATWGFGVSEYDMVVHRFVHIGRLCIDLEQHPDPALITLNIHVPKSWLRRFKRS